VSIIPTFDQIKIRNQIDVSSVELMKSWRLEPFHNKTFFELYLGARYLSIEERFRFEGAGGSLDGTVLHGNAQNHIVGPQVALRYEQRVGNWKINADGRFVAGFNVQNLSTSGSVGANVTPGGLNQPFIFQPTTYRTDKTDNQFSPVAELRLDAAYAVTKSIAVKAGWTGMFVGRVARGSALIDYSLAEPGLLSNAEPVFSNGVNFGIEVNR
ncbi:MAG: BBP7 family outer membrane beta-barrel protein, partial [Planctomycetales bacterium]|nr:BBP7 family outer membrane beta-barrel protein [Planctomycetales bacterium]